MNIYKELNKVIEYIEQNLEEEIDYNVFAKMLGTNEYTMQRIFSFLCDVSLAEYIRNRRLSNAGYDLQNSKNKIIDIAIKYGYESATSFSRAFEKFHGIKPSKVKENTSTLKVYPKLVFDENITLKKDNIEYSVVSKGELVLYGEYVKTEEGKIGKDAPKFFEEFKNKYTEKYGFPVYGLTEYKKRFEDCNLKYWVLYDRKIEGLKKFVIPASKWVMMKIETDSAEDIQRVTNEFYLDFLPSSKYKLSELPDLEYYHDDRTDLLIPIEN